MARNKKPVTIPGMMPDRIFEEVNRILEAAAVKHFAAIPKPSMSIAAAAKLFIAPDDIAICKRAKKLYPAAGGYQYYYHETRGNMLTFYTPENNEYYFPEQHEDSQMAGSAFEQELNAWLDHLDEVNQLWGQVAQMAFSFQYCKQPLSVLKALWPDFDLIFKLPVNVWGKRPSDDWLPRWHALGKPRDVEFPMPNCMNHLELVRRTVLSALLLPKTFSHAQEEVTTGLKVRETERNIVTPWGKSTPKLVMKA